MYIPEGTGDFVVTQNVQSGPTQSITVEDPNTTAELHVDITETGPNAYSGTGSFTYPLTQALADGLNDGISEANSALVQLNQPQLNPVSAGDTFTISLPSFGLDKDAGTVNSLATGGAGDLNGQFEINGVGSSIGATATGGNLFLFEGGDPVPRSRMTSYGANTIVPLSSGQVEMSYQGVDASGATVVESFYAPRRAPGPEGDGYVSYFVNDFNGGVLAGAGGVSELATSVAAGHVIGNSFFQATNAMAACCASGKYLCVRHIVSYLGGGTLCCIAVALAAGGTAATAGTASPALVAALVACLGGSVLIAIDMILAHMGFA